MRLLDRFHYETLALSEDGKTERKSPFRVFLSSPRCYYITATLSIIPATLFCALFLIHVIHPESLASPPHPPPQRWTSCGSSPDEARSRGCRFDILSFAWQTPECYDGELMDDFLAYDDWTFYTEYNTADTNKTVDRATALEGNMGLFVDWKYHVTHCTFMWRQMHRAFTVRGFIDSHLDNYNHTRHCQRTLLDRDTPMESVTVIARLRYPECREIGGPEGGKGMIGGGY